MWCDARRCDWIFFFTNCTVIVLGIVVLLWYYSISMCVYTYFFSLSTFCQKVNIHTENPDEQWKKNTSIVPKKNNNEGALWCFFLQPRAEIIVLLREMYNCISMAQNSLRYSQILSISYTNSIFVSWKSKAGRKIRLFNVTNSSQTYRSFWMRKNCSVWKKKLW